MLCLDDCFATAIITQPTEITQFIFSQPLRDQAFARLCHGNDNAHALREKNCRGSCSCESALPVSSCFGAEYPQCGSRNQVALEIEGIVDGGMHAEEALGGSSRLEPPGF